MISRNEIRQKARENGVPVSTIERDYVQNWILKYLSQINMVLKGGTGIRKVYIGNYRFSDDLDFTLLEAIHREKLEALIKELVERAREESGINFDDNVKIKENMNGFTGEISFQIMQKGGSKTKIKIDITKFTNEKIMLPIEERQIIHRYSDNINSNVRVYSLEEIMSEKIRSLFQRTRPRDLYDVWRLWDKVDMGKVLEILAKKFKVKNVRADIRGFEIRKDHFKNAWKNSLQHQLKYLPDFEKVFESVFERIKPINKEKQGMERNTIKVKVKTLTPLWTGDAEGKCSELKLTGIIGSLRWWFEALVRGMGYNVCDSTGHKCEVEIKKPEDALHIQDKICPVYYLFGTTGWKSRFSVKILNNNLSKPYNGKVVVKSDSGGGWHYESGLMGDVDLEFDYEDQILIRDGKSLHLKQVFPSILKILLYLIGEYGMLGAKTSMGYGVVKFQINGEDITVGAQDWENFKNYLEFFKDNFYCENFQGNFQGKQDKKIKNNLKTLPNLESMFFIKFGIQDEIGTIIGKMKTFYKYQDGVVEGDVDRWKNSGWVITSPIVRKCIRCIFRGKYSERVCSVKRDCERNYWWSYRRGNTRNNSNYRDNLTIDKLNLTKEDVTEIRHFLMGKVSRDNTRFSAIQVSHVYQNGDNLEFRIYGWLPNIKPLKGNVNEILELLNSLFTDTPWNDIIPSQIQEGICWNGSNLSLIQIGNNSDKNKERVKELFVKNGGE